MELNTASLDKIWWVFTFPAFLNTRAFLFFIAITVAFSSIHLIACSFSSGGFAWANGRNRLGRVPIPGPRGLPIFGSLFSFSHGLAHRSLARMAAASGTTELMAISLGSTPAVVTSDPRLAREILTSPHFADRPIKTSARLLMFSRAIGFAPNGSYWRLLRRIASTHLFSPKRVAAHERGRQLCCATMVRDVVEEQSSKGAVVLRRHLQMASLNNIMGTVFGRQYHAGEAEAEELKELVREGFELLGAFNWSDHLPWLSHLYDPLRLQERCLALVHRVRGLVKGIIDDHRASRAKSGRINECVLDNLDFVDVLLSLEGDEQLQEDDMVAVLWEMIFRGTDTTALLTEWIMAELVLNPQVQANLRHELHSICGPTGTIADADVARAPYLQAVIKETLRLHPPGPLLSWARLSKSDVHLSNGMVVPSNTTAFVNMWAITHDPQVWAEADQFKPERFLEEGGGDVDVRGTDLRLAPFGAGRRVCPGKNLGLVTVGLWAANLVRDFGWVEDPTYPVDLSEVLKLSCEMKKPLLAVAVPFGPERLV